MTANTKGIVSQPFQLQNQQTNSADIDDSHIICGQLATQPTWNSNDIHIKGNLIFENGNPFQQSNEIKSTDNTSNIVCDNGNIINQNAQLININSQPSSQHYIVYGQPNGENNAQQQYNIPFPDPDVTKSDFDLKLWGYPSLQTWFTNDFLNKPNNQYIQADGDCFRLLQPQNQMVDITIRWQLRFVEDGANPKCNVCCGLFDRSSNQIVPQSLQWYNFNDVKFKYVSMTTTFTMRCDNANHAYFPFYQQQNGGAFNQFTTTEISGKCRSSIQFKFYQFIQY